MGQATRLQVHFGGELGVAVGTGMVGGLIGQGWNRVSVLDGTWKIERQRKRKRDVQGIWGHNQGSVLRI